MSLLENMEAMNLEEEYSQIPVQQAQGIIRSKKDWHDLLKDQGTAN